MLETMLMVMILMTLMVRVRLLSLARAEDRATDIGWDARWQCSTTIFWGQFCSTWGGGKLNTSCQECRESSTHDWDLRLCLATATAAWPDPSSGNKNNVLNIKFEDCQRMFSVSSAPVMLIFRAFLICQWRKRREKDNFETQFTMKPWLTFLCFSLTDLWLRITGLFHYKRDLTLWFPNKH